jgi:Uma2 family endonuclease
MVAQPRDTQDWILRAFLDLDLPEGLRAELIDGEIVVVPPPNLAHNDILFWISRQILVTCPAMGTWRETGLVTPRGHYVPDLIVAPLDWGKQDVGPWAPAADVDLVVEVTSSRPEDDRHAKRLGYAEALIPLYLLVDRDRRECVLYSDPGDGDYHQSYRAAFDSEIFLPGPFDFALLTDSFLR